MNASLHTVATRSLSLLALAGIAFAQGSPDPRPLRSTRGVHTTALNITVNVVDGVATTKLKQTIRNDSNVALAEAIWVLPLPEGAAADDFEMLVNGVRMSGEVLGAEGARTVYENIVRKRRDPGLLEYVGRGCLRARVFPIPAGEEVGVEVSYRHVLQDVAGLSRWSFPIAAAGVDGRAPDNVTLDLSIHSKRSIKNAFSPSALVDVRQKDDHSVRASFEAKASSLPTDELAVLYGLSEKDFGLNLLSHRPSKGDGPYGQDGTFLMLISPKRDWGDAVVTKKDITFVVDTSGSMAGEKIDQAKASLLFFLRSLRAEDRFNVVPFSTEARPFFDARVEASKENVARAVELVGDIHAVGGTNISDALRVSLGGAPSPTDDDRVRIVVFLTDGVPTVGTTSRAAILDEVRRANGDAATRIFVLGVGHDVNTHLLDSLAAEARGTRDYVRPNENIELKASALFTKLANPVLTDLELTVDGVRVSRLVPGELADLFEGERLEIFGRYAASGASAIRLTGRFRGTERVYVFEGTFADGPSKTVDFLPRLWAQRRVGVLLDAIRLNGEKRELVDEVTRIGREFRIVTPYTSNLILEPGDRAENHLATRDAEALRGLGYTDGRRGGAAAGPASPRSIASGGADTGSDGFFLGRGSQKAERAEREVDLDAVVAGLRASEIVDDDTPADEVVALAQQVKERLSAAAIELKAMGETRDVGSRAVAQSQHLERLIRGGTSGESQALLELFTRRVNGKVFRLRRGVWTDLAIRTDDGAQPLPRTRVEAFSPAYFELLRERSELRPYFALGTRVAVLIDGAILETTPAS